MLGERLSPAVRVKGFVEYRYCIFIILYGTLTRSNVRVPVNEFQVEVQVGITAHLYDVCFCDYDVIRLAERCIEVCD